MSARVSAHHISFVFREFHDVHEPHVGQGISHTRPVGVGVQPVVLSLSLVIVTSYQDQSPCLGSALVENSTSSILIREIREGIILFALAQTRFLDSQTPFKGPQNIK